MKLENLFKIEFTMVFDRSIHERYICANSIQDAMEKAEIVLMKYYKDNQAYISSAKDTGHTLILLDNE